jgi:hypothetical protein
MQRVVQYPQVFWGALPQMQENARNQRVSLKRAAKVTKHHLTKAERKRIKARAEYEASCFS